MKQYHIHYHPYKKGKKTKVWYGNIFEAIYALLFIPKHKGDILQISSGVGKLPSNN